MARIAATAAAPTTAVAAAFLAAVETPLLAKTSKLEAQAALAVAATADKAAGRKQTGRVVATEAAHISSSGATLS